MVATEYRCYGMQAQLAKRALLKLLDAMEEEVQPRLQWLAELDVTISLAEVSEQHCFCRPDLTDENVLQITKGATMRCAWRWRKSDSADR
jgi:DNA mismatch repair ATPase MutS